MARPLPPGRQQPAEDPVLRSQVDAQRWPDEMTAALVTGQYVDPKAGQQTVREYAEQWRVSQVHRPTTAAHVETMLRLHVHPALGDRPLASVLPSDVQSLTKRLSGRLAPSTVGVVHRILAAVCKAAVRDRRIVASPCEGTRLPKDPRERIEPLSVEAVQALTDAMPDRYRALVTLAAGTGLRQGEAFGLGVDRIDFLRRQLTLDRQLITLPGRPPYLAAPQDAGVDPDHPAARRRSRCARGASGHVTRRRAGLHDRAQRADPADRLLGPGVASGREGRRPAGVGHLPRAAALLRLAAHPARRVGQDGPGPTGARERRRDARHLQPPVAGLGRPDEGRRRLRAEDR
jgi:hypothetical protein